MKLYIAHSAAKADLCNGDIGENQVFIIHGEEHYFKKEDDQGYEFSIHHGVPVREGTK
jgi:hypothetical protein